MKNLLLFFIDLVIIISLSFTSFIFRFNSSPAAEYNTEITRMLKSLPFTVVFILLLMIYKNEYKPYFLKNLWERFGSIFESVTMGIFLTVLAYVIGNEREFSRLLVIYQWILIILALFIFRVIYFKLINKKKGCIISSTEDTKKYSHLEIIDIKQKNIWEHIGKQGYSFAIISFDLIKEYGLNIINEITKYVSIPVLLSSCEENVMFINSSPVLFKDSTYFLITPEKNIFNIIIKRFIDIFLSLLFIIILFPVLIIIYISIKIFDKSNPIFIHKRVGQFGKIFNMYKFRTMRDSAEGSKITLENDDRITKTGSVLRRWSLDELPQLFNILAGNMSFVGPRPEIEEIVKDYDYWQKKVLTIKPGLTGLAQVSGRDDLTVSEKLVLDIYYINHYSIWMDMWIIIKTIGVIFCGKGIKY